LSGQLGEEAAARQRADRTPGTKGVGILGQPGLQLVASQLRAADSIGELAGVLLADRRLRQGQQSCGLGQSG
jgi:hypothetical protein